MAWKMTKKKLAEKLVEYTGHDENFMEDFICISDTLADAVTRKIDRMTRKEMLEWVTKAEAESGRFDRYSHIKDGCTVEDEDENDEN